MNEIQFNRLLDYRSLDQLSRMNDSDRAGLLDEVLRKPPSETPWQATLELFATWPDGQSKAQNLDVALKALSTWPDKLRFLHSANRLLYDGTRLSTLARLVRSIEVHRREQQGSAELMAIVSSEYSDELRCLSIDRSEIDSRSWQALAESPHLSNLRHLHVRKTLFGSSTLQTLFQSASLPQLHCLKLIDVGIRPQHLESLRHLTRFAELCAVDLSSNALGDESAKMLSQLPRMPQVKRLSLREVYMGARAIQELISSPFCQGVEEIDVAGNRLTDTEKKELVALAQTKNINLKA